ncbi:hypothetical protein [Streptomyces sp. NPDC058401]|uniref:hypothetical protein n=1 Tax=Streptomyces sp. NPDC058401 TaxID=3346480 RepID=UPI003664B4B9
MLSGLLLGLAALLTRRAVSAADEGPFTLVAAVGLWLLGAVVVMPVAAPAAPGLVGWMVRGWSGPALTLALTQARRTPRRSAGTAAAVMVGVSLVASLAVVGESAQAQVRREQGYIAGRTTRPPPRAGPGLTAQEVRTQRRFWPPPGRPAAQHGSNPLSRWATDATPGRPR